MVLLTFAGGDGHGALLPVPSMSLSVASLGPMSAPSTR
jgi:hypothetical protein